MNALFLAALHNRIELIGWFQSKGATWHATDIVKLAKHNCWDITHWILKNTNVDRTNIEKVRRLAIKKNIAFLY